MKFMQRYVRGRWREKEERSEQKCAKRVEAGASRDPVPDRCHGGEGKILHHDKKHWMPKKDENRRKKKNNRFDVIAKEGDTLDRDVEAAMDQLPDGLDIVSQVEGAVFKIGPSRE